MIFLINWRSGKKKNLEKSWKKLANRLKRSRKNKINPIIKKGPNDCLYDLDDRNAFSYKQNAQTKKNMKNKGFCFVYFFSLHLNVSIFLKNFVYYSD